MRRLVEPATRETEVEARRELVQLLRRIDNLSAIRSSLAKPSNQTM